MPASAPAGGPARRTMTRSFRNRMLKQALGVFAAVAAVLLILVGTLGRTAFLIAAAVLIPASALGFNFLQRRAYAAQQRGR